MKVTRKIGYTIEVDSGEMHHLKEALRKDMTSTAEGSEWREQVRKMLEAIAVIYVD